MKLIFRLAWLWASIQLAASQCVLETEFFCSSIPNDFPEGLTSVLFVVTNLGVINSTVFSSPSLASVTSLALANSGITNIEPGAFHAFQSLTKLSLYQNSLTNVMASWLSNPGRLENLTAAQNLIAKIDPNTFSGFSNLSTLNLASNQIDQIVGGSFKGLSKLRLIDLSSNRLTTLTRDAFRGPLTPPAMKLGGNPWNCSCELRDFGLFLQELINASLLEDATSVVCHSPPRLEGVQVWNISDLNCPPDIVTSAVGNSFHKVGLPTLLACLVFISFIVLLFWIWLMKHNIKQVQPSKEAADRSIRTKPSSQADSMSECQQSDEKIRATEMGTASETRMLKPRANSASAILLRAAFRQEQPQNTGLVDAKLTMPYVSLNDKVPDGSEDLHQFMELWHSQKPKECEEKKFQTHSDAESFLTEVCIEKPRVKVPSEATKQILQDSRSSETLEVEDVKGYNSVENSEPFLYLSVATVTEKQVDAQFENDVLTKTDGNHLVSLKRTFTWPEVMGQRSNVLSVRASFIAQYFVPTFHLDESLDAWKPGPNEQWLHIPPRKEHQLCTVGEPELNEVAKLAKETGPPSKSESNVEADGESTDVKKSQFNEEPQRQCDLSKCSRKDDRTELNTEEDPTNEPKCPLQKESKVAIASRCVYTSQSGIKATKYASDVKNKQPSKPVSSQSGVGREIPPSPPPSANVALTSSPYEDNVVLLENNDNNYINLLHEVVENRGRWTRERWRQTHRIHAINQLNKSK